MLLEAGEEGEEVANAMKLLCGWNGVRDDSEAIKICTRHPNDAQANYILCFVHQYGRAVPVDFQKAFKYALIASELSGGNCSHSSLMPSSLFSSFNLPKGHPAALDFVGDVYALGRCGETDPQKAAKNYARAARKGRSFSIEKLETILKEKVPLQIVWERELHFFLWAKNQHFHSLVFLLLLFSHAPECALPKDLIFEIIKRIAL